MLRKFLRTSELLSFNPQSVSHHKSTSTSSMGITLEGAASSLTRGIVQWSEEGYGYMTREEED